MDKIKKYFTFLRRRITNEVEQVHISFNLIFVIFAVVSLFMSIVNYFTSWRILMWSTIIYSLANWVNIFLSLRVKLSNLPKLLFTIETFALLTSFIIIGEPQGFSIVWIFLLPVGGMLLYKRKYGPYVIGAMLLIVIFFFWIPFGQSLLQYPYSDSFKLRFPFAYIAFFAIGYAFELIRTLTQEDLIKARDQYRKASITDSLTGLYNEAFYISKTSQLDSVKEPYAVVVMDVNCVKKTNDRYGHRFGCHLIVTAGKTLPIIFPNSTLFHMGGDEFVAIVQGDDLTNLDGCLKAFEERLRYDTITFEGKTIILSVAYGCATHYSRESYKETFQRADNLMYRNKTMIKQLFDLPSR